MKKITIIMMIIIGINAINVNIAKSNSFENDLIYKVEEDIETVKKDHETEYKKNEEKVEVKKIEELKKAKAVKSGWIKVSGRWKYLNDNGAFVTGWKKDKGSWYYLNNNGVMETGWKKVSGAWYYLNSDGKMATGWKKLQGSWYYLNSSGKMVTGWLKNNGKDYYLNNSGKMLVGQQKINNQIYYFDTNGALNNAMAVVKEVKKHIGKAYVSGAEGPNSFDCSGLTKYVYGKIGIKLSRTTYSQVKQGKYVSKNDLKPGDLVFSHGPVSVPGHVGIYVGNGRYVHASTSKTGVIESPIYKYSTARRIL